VVWFELIKIYGPEYDASRPTIVPQRLAAKEKADF